MGSLLSAITPDGLKQALIVKGARWAGTFVGGAIATWAISHTEIMSWVNQACVAINDPTNAATGFGAVAVAAAMLFYSLKDAKQVDAKITTAAATGSVSAANDSSIRTATVEAVQAGEIEAPHGYIHPKTVSAKGGA